MGVEETAEEVMECTGIEVYELFEHGNDCIKFVLNVLVSV